MKNFHRTHTAFSLCGLNCALCPMKLGGHCPGCGGGEGNQSCAIARCSLEHGGVAWCCQCPEYPCRHYVQPCADSFISHRNQLEDMARFQAMGQEAYLSQLAAREQILKTLLAHYNDGRRKTLFCNAANLLPLEALKEVLAQLPPPAPNAQAPDKAEAALAASLLKARADALGISLKLQKKA